MAGTESVDTIELALALLRADTSLSSLLSNGWFKDIAQGVSWPFGIVQFQGGADMVFVGAIRVGLNGLLTVKVVGLDGTFTSVLRPAARRVDVVLQAQQGSNSDILIIGKFNREEPIDFSEVVNNQVIRHLGGTYRFQAQ